MYELPPREETGDDPNHTDDRLIDAVQRDRRQVYKMRPIIESLVNRGSFMEIGKYHGRSIITGFARLDGWHALNVSYSGGFPRRRDHRSVRDAATFV